MKSRFSAIMIMMIALLTGCTNGKMAGMTLAPALDTSTSLSTSTNSLITIQTVVRDNIDPTGTIDVIGDGSNAIAARCTLPAGSSSPTPSSTGGTSPGSNCTCDFTYDVPDPNSVGNELAESLEVNTAYVEGNELRCPIDQIPSTVTTLSVAVRVLNVNNLSNQIAFNLNSAGTVMDMTNIANFSRVYRYTCRDKVFIPNILDPVSGIYDPVQSEDPKNSYPLDFYTTNIGATLNAYAGGGGVTAPTNWNCPANPLNPSADYQVPLYSQSPVSGNEVISGTLSGGTINMNDNNARSTFYLAKNSSGVFTLPVDAYIAPNIISSASGPTNTAGGGIPNLGFGAYPIATSSNGTERCPDSSVTIPAGFQWVKVWLFRTSLPARKFLDSPNLRNLGQIGCSPGAWPTSVSPYPPVPYNSIVPDCVQFPSLQTGSGSTFVAGRFAFATGACFGEYSSGGSPGSAGGASGVSINGDPLATGSDRWIPPSTSIAGTYDPQYDCAGTTPNPILSTLHLCNSPYNGAFFDGNPVTGNIDDPSSVRYEFLFVVTPTTVNTSDMSNTSSAVLAQYTPYRFPVAADCPSNTPDTSGCNFNLAFRTYGLKLHDVSDAGDPPAGDSSDPAVFPVCALQPIGL